VQRKVAEQNRKPGGKKKKKPAGGSASEPAPMAPATSGGVSAAGMGLVNAAAGDGDWAKIPKKAGAKKKKPQLPDSNLGFTSKFGMALLEEED